MLDKFGQISPLQRVVLDMFITSGASPGQLITISIHSAATNGAVSLMVPAHATPSALLHALAVADKEGTLIPPTAMKSSPALVRSQTREVLGTNVPLVHYNLQQGETLEIRFPSGQSMTGVDYIPKQARRRPESKGQGHQASGLPGWSMLLMGAALLLCTVVVGIAVLASRQFIHTPQTSVAVAPTTSSIGVAATSTPKEVVVSPTPRQVVATATSRVVPPPNTPVPTDRPTPANTPVPTDRPTPANTPEPTACPDPSPYGLNAAQISRLGCSTQGWVSSRNVVIQRFENGVMVIFAKPSNVFDNKGGGAIYALANDHRVWRITDTFVETSSDPDDWYACQRKPGQRPEKSGIPWRGFGKAWCEHPEVRTALGNARSAELVSSSSFQSYESGRAFQVFDWKGFQGWASRRVYIVYLSSVDGAFRSGSWE
jgi:hypothetical protein